MNFLRNSTFPITEYILNPDAQPETLSEVPKCPVIVFINSKSGGQLGTNLLVTYRSLLNENQVIDLLEQAPDKFLSKLYLNLEMLKQKDELALRINWRFLLTFYEI